MCTHFTWNPVANGSTPANACWLFDAEAGQEVPSASAFSGPKVCATTGAQLATKPTAPVSSTGIQKMFKRLDANKDSVVTLDEFRKVYSLQSQQDVENIFKSFGGDVASGKLDFNTYSQTMATKQGQVMEAITDAAVDAQADAKQAGVSTKTSLDQGNSTAATSRANRVVGSMTNMTQEVVRNGQNAQQDHLDAAAMADGSTSRNSGDDSTLPWWSWAVGGLGAAFLCAGVYAGIAYSQGGSGKKSGSRTRGISASLGEPSSPQSFQSHDDLERLDSLESEPLADNRSSTPAYLQPPVVAAGGFVAPLPQVHYQQPGQYAPLVQGHR